MRRLLVIALALDVVGAGGALLFSTRTWQTLAVDRPRPLAEAVVGVTGRTLDPAGTAIALVGLAGVVALLATRGRGRQVIGVALVLAGAGLVWRSTIGLAAVSQSRARELASSRSGIGLDGSSAVRISVHGGWASAGIICGVLVLAAGVLTALRGHAWSGLAARYEAPAPDRTDASLWSALDRGDDPTGD